MFRAHCFVSPNGDYTPGVPLETAEEVVQYCWLLHNTFPEIRVTEDDGEYIVAHVLNHVFIVPQADGSLKRYDMVSGKVIE